MQVVAQVVDIIVLLNPLGCEDRVLTLYETKMVPVQSHNDFSRPLVEKGVV